MARAGSRRRPTRKVRRKPKLGSGKRFKTLAKKVGSKKLAAWIGRRKYGKKRFAKLAKHGRIKKK